MIYNPTGVGEIELDTVILDLNGTLALNGEIIAGAKERIQSLKELGFKIYLFTGDQRGNAATQAASLGVEVQLAKNSDEKEALSKKLNQGKTVAIGNARIDMSTFKESKIRIATLQSEGIHKDILEFIDIVVPSVNDALDLLINTNSFEATMRK